MKFRLKAFSLHLAASAVVLTLVLGGLYLGWYRWPGWYLCEALTVVPILMVVDLTIGPLLTLLVANPRKPRRELARDISIIVGAQLVALVYGAGTLWHGRPLYYTFSEDRLQLVQASDIDAAEVARAIKENPALAPHWYNLPRWVWAPLPDDAAERKSIMTSALLGGNDVIDMPRYFKPWEAGLPALRARLLPLDRQSDFRLRRARTRLKAQMLARKFDPEQPATLLMTGHALPLVAVFDRDTLRLRALLRTDR